MNKFGDKIGLEVWDAVNKVFDCMPLAAIIDGRVSNNFVLNNFCSKLNL